MSSSPVRKPEMKQRSKPCSGPSRRLSTISSGACCGGRSMPGMHVGANIDLERAFEGLSETSRAVVWLHDVEGYTHEEIGEQMGKSVSFSKSQLARAHT